MDRGLMYGSLVLLCTARKLLIKSNLLKWLREGDPSLRGKTPFIPSCFLHHCVGLTFLAGNSLVPRSFLVGGAKVGREGRVW